MHNLSYAQFATFMDPFFTYNMGRLDATLDIRAIGIGNFNSGNRPFSALHVNTNLMTSDPDFLPGEVFRTDCPALFAVTNPVSAWRMFVNGNEIGGIYNHLATPNDMTIHAITGNMVFNTTGFEHLRITSGTVPTMVNPALGAVIRTDNLDNFIVSNWASNTGFGPFHPLTVFRVVGDGDHGDATQVVPVAEFRRNFQSGQETAIKIRGQRYTLISSSTPPANSASIWFSNYDNDEIDPNTLLTGVDYVMAKIASGMELSGGQTGNLSFFTNEGIVNNGLQERIRIIRTGNVGINTITPNNALEINSYAGNPTPSGLRFTNLTSAGPYGPANAFALTVDPNGDVILAQNTGGFGLPCPPTSAGPYWNLLQDWRVGLDNSTLYFAGQHIGAKSNVAIGLECGDALIAKLNVIQKKPIMLYGINSGDQCWAGYFMSKPDVNVIWSNALTGQAYGNAQYSSGVFGQSDNGNYNIGVMGGAPHNPAHTFFATWHNWAGYFNGPVYSSVNFYPSDSILKTGMTSISNSLSIIDSLQPKAFYYDTTYAFSKGLNLPAGLQFGFEAQDVQKVLDNLVVGVTNPPQHDTLGNETFPAYTFKAINYNGFIGILTQGVQDLDSITQGISDRVSGLPKISFGAKCDIDSGSFELPSNWRVGLNDKNLYFDGQDGSGGNNIGVGYTCDDALVGKLSVWEATQIDGSSVAGYFNNTATGNFAASVMGTTDKSNAKDNYAGFFTAQSSHGDVNTGVLAIAKNGKQNYGIWAEAPQNTTNQHASVAAYINGNLDGVGVNLYVSDAKFKNNVQNITNATDIIEQLQPRTFNFNTTGYPYMNFNTGNQYGFVAQEMISVLPDLVKNSIFRAEYDSFGNMIHDTIQYKSLNYEGLIPIVIQAVKELKTKNDSITDKLNDRVDSLRQVVIANNTVLLQKNDSLWNVLNTFNTRLTAIEDRLEECCKGHNGNGNHSLLTNPNTENTTEVELENVQAIVLDQNVPNPFAESTVITYFIPDNINYAQIIFTDNYGRIMKTVDIKTSGDGMIKVYAANLSSGTYTYSLMVDGKVVESKKMMCVK